jgi:hypothetical protein
MDNLLVPTGHVGARIIPFPTDRRRVEDDGPPPPSPVPAAARQPAPPIKLDIVASDRPRVALAAGW